MEFEMGTRGTWANLMRWLGGSQRRRVRRLPDFADHGTAFGLDLSLSAQMTTSAALNAKVASGLGALSVGATTVRTTEAARTGR
jgi:hypothetical protein